MRHFSVCIAALTVLGAIACGGAQSPAPSSPRNTSIAPPTRPIHMRVAFDADPTAYVGRFVPDSVKDEEIDETKAVTTRCSKYFEPKEIAADQAIDEMVYVSRDSSARLGILPVATGSASSTSSHVARVRYRINKKIQSVVKDPKGFDECCAADKSQCSGRIISEFVMGSGEVLAANDDIASAELAGASSNVVGSASQTSADGWRKVNQFNNVYFAFVTGAARLGEPVAQNPKDCSWCENIPKSQEGAFFCGVSPEVVSETMARDYAMRDARQQVIKYLAEQVSAQSATTADAFKGYLSDQQVITSAADGVASRVKDDRWCAAEPVRLPDGTRYKSRVLAFLPNSEVKSALKVAVLSVIEKKKSIGKLTPEQERALRQLAGE